MGHLRADNVQKIIDLLEALPDHKFDMSAWIAKPADTEAGQFTPEQLKHCGTACCIGGWAEVLRREEEGYKLEFHKNAGSALSYMTYSGEEYAGNWIGLADWGERHDLFYAPDAPTGLFGIHKENAIGVLKDMIARNSTTPDWSPEGPANWKQWQLDGASNEEDWKANRQLDKAEL